MLVERALARGDRVIATLRKAGALDDLAARHGDTLQTLRVDLTDVDGLREAVDQAFANAGHIDVVVSNAGYGLVGAAEELTDAQIARQLATNLTGSIQLIRAVLPHLRRQGGGRIVQVSSEGGQVTYPAFSLYHATKWGIEGFVEAVAQEVAGFGIDFILAEPGPTDTRFGAGIDMAQAMPEYANTPAGMVRHAVESRGFPLTGDAGRTADVMLRVIDLPHPPLRLALGSVAYGHIKPALVERLRVLEAHKEDAYWADKQTI
jgi:NAD(P)-dependent dehydrogenase (short-subunit alcohol dehydrogenase family)